MTKNLFHLALTTALILLIPFGAMLFTNEVKWTHFDFVFAGALIFGTGLLFQLARKKAAGDRAYQLGTGLALAAVFLLIWVNGAVGIIGNENNPLSLTYLGVIGIVIIGSLLARFRPRGMMHALYATAIAQALVPMVALAAESPALFHEPPGVLGVFVINFCFVGLFVASALLFRRSSKHPADWSQPSARIGFAS
jgi:hypothetical protein